MSYENKEYILQFFEGVHEEENRAELIEVYRKAKAFDEIKGYNDRVFEGDLDSFDLSEAVGDVIETYTIKRIIESGDSDD